MRPAAVFLWLFLLVAMTARSALADTSAPLARSDPLTVELLTMGPGEHPFFKFGHNAIRIRDARTGTDVVYNYGTFSFTSPTLIRDFFKGRLEYWLSKESMSTTLAHYAGEDRSLFAQRLALSPEQKLVLKAQLETNAKPRNRAYKYDYFFDNCSTRVRDAIDRVTDGQLHRALRGPASQSLRDHALRATADYFVEYLVLAIGLGPQVDQPTDGWAEAFLPEMLATGVRRATVRAADGSEHPLVADEALLLPHDDVRLEKAPAWAWRFGVVGFLCGLATLLVAWLSRRSRASSVVLGTVLGSFGALVGLLGCALVALWAFTDHAVAFRNQNILVLSPFALGLTWSGIRIARCGLTALGRTRNLALLLVVSSLAAAFLKLTPLEHQDNTNLIAFFLPYWLGLLAATTWAARVTNFVEKPVRPAALVRDLRPRTDNPREIDGALATSDPER